jgi:phosphoribosylanthranilate isomerase
MTFVKICGITRLDDARAALESGARAIGFVFWPRSPRYVEPGRAREIVRGLGRPAIAVGVFVNQDVDEMNAVAEAVGLQAVQLHGDERPETAGRIARPVIKALAGPGLAPAHAAWPACTTLLIDAHDPERRGGTGTMADWNAARALARRRRIMLAGGLTPENVGAAIAAVRPYGIDVSSGVESAPGIKDPARIAALFDAIEAAGL